MLKNHPLTLQKILNKNGADMAGTSIPEIRDFHDIVRVLETHPEWRADLRRLILTDELLAVPELTARLAEQLTQVTGQIQALAAAQYRTETQLATLTEITQRMGVDIGRLKGDGLEVRYTLRGIPLLTQLVRRPQPLSQAELDALLGRRRNARPAL